MDQLKLSAVEMGRQIAAGRLDPVDLTDAFHEAIVASPVSDRIYARVSADRARAEALAARERVRSGARRGPLDGVPISWKDLFDTKDIATEAGSALLEGRVPTEDALAVKRATDAGMICLGKTHMSELAFSGLGLNPITETPPNVYDAGLAPGGSSSGAGTSVAFGLAALGMGSDTGGSIRIPAAWNGIVGFKPTHGVIPTTGVVPLCNRFDTVGPLSRTVHDAAAMFSILVARAHTPPADISLYGLRFAVPDPLMEDLDNAVATAFDAVLHKLSAAGAMVERIEAPALREAIGMAPILFPTEAYGIWRDVIEANPDKMFPEILERFRSGAKHSAPDYVAALIRLEELRALHLAEIDGFNATLAPTCPVMPPALSRLESDSAFYKHVNLMTLRNTRSANVMGWTSLTVPSHENAVGAMISAPARQEDFILSVGSQLECVLH